MHANNIVQLSPLVGCGLSSACQAVPAFDNPGEHKLPQRKLIVFARFHRTPEPE